jgi:polyhydroxyalkanoate synthesis repressor PhaR
MIAGRGKLGKTALGSSREEDAAAKMSNASSPITIKKYANRRLYNTATSSYVTLDHLCQMVKDNEDFVVYDAKTGEDITRSVLTQIIVEEEGKGGQNLLPIPFLRQLIGFYGDSLGGLVPKYLEHAMQAFQHHEEQMRQYMSHAFEGLFPFNTLEEVNKQNAAFFENAMKMFAPFYGAAGEGLKSAMSGSEATIEALQRKLAEMQNQLNKLSQPTKGKDK